VATLSVLSGELVDYVVKPNFRALGRRFGRQTPAVAAAIARRARRRGRGHCAGGRHR